MKKTYSKPQMFSESFAISEHFAAGTASACEDPVHSGDVSAACYQQYSFGPGFQAYTMPIIPSCTDDWGCYHIVDGDKESAFYS